MTANQLITRLGPKIAWSAAVILILVLVVFAAIRTIDTYGGEPQPGLFEARYLEHPLVTAVHMLTGLAFVVLAPLQLSRKFRTGNLGLHRGLGRVLVVCALLAGIYGMIATLVLPVFGGVASEAASWFFGLMFIFCLLRAYWCVRKRKIAQHREWMIRSFALGLGVGTQRLVLALMIAFTDYSMYENFGPALWLGFAINLVVAEIWLNHTRGRA
ncbi:MAG: DUF2306 domain-containing protein [Gammaproteobacteria bacterium]|nr:DUF2306 domain-containing protein [Gammaproteobacteria bacterium]